MQICSVRLQGTVGKEKGGGKWERILPTRKMASISDVTSDRLAAVSRSVSTVDQTDLCLD